jgi:hypothetical protein
MAVQRAGGAQHLVTDLARERLQAVNRKILAVVVVRANVKGEVVLRAEDSVTDRAQELHLGVCALFDIWVTIASCSSPGIGIYFALPARFVAFRNVFTIRGFNFVAFNVLAYRVLIAARCFIRCIAFTAIMCFFVGYLRCM